MTSAFLWLHASLGSSLLQQHHNLFQAKVQSARRRAPAATADGQVPAAAQLIAINCAWPTEALNIKALVATSLCLSSCRAVFPGQAWPTSTNDLQELEVIVTYPASSGQPPSLVSIQPHVCSSHLSCSGAS